MGQGRGVAAFCLNSLNVCRRVSPTSLPWVVSVACKCKTCNDVQKEGAPESSAAAWEPSWAHGAILGGQNLLRMGWVRRAVAIGQQPSVPLGEGLSCPELSHLSAIDVSISAWSLLRGICFTSKSRAAYEKSKKKHCKIFQRVNY